MVESAYGEHLDERDETDPVVQRELCERSLQRAEMEVLMYKAALETPLSAINKVVTPSSI